MYIRTSCKNILLRLLSSFRFLSIHSCVASASVAGDLHYRTQAKKNTQLFDALIFWQGNLFLRIFLFVSKVWGESKSNFTSYTYIPRCSQFCCLGIKPTLILCCCGWTVGWAKIRDQGMGMRKNQKSHKPAKEFHSNFFFKQRRLKNHATAAAVSFSSRPTT